MQVESVGGGAWQVGQPVRNHVEVVQDVFSAVLEAAGRSGYASAQTISEEEPLTEQIVTTWSDWFDGQRATGRYRGAADAASLKQSYGEILVRVYEEGGFENPKSFLDGLSDEELEVVQEVHRLADPISVSSLTEEGALNLLVPPPAQVDVNRDGVTRNGAAYGMRFPDSNTPPEVVSAWAEATAGMSMQDRMIYEFRMKLPLLTANIVCDKDGRFVTRYEPGDPEFTNPMAADNYPYVEATQDWLDYLDRFRTQIPPERREKDMAFWTRFQALLVEFGAT